MGNGAGVPWIPKPGEPVRGASKLRLLVYEDSQTAPQAPLLHCQVYLSASYRAPRCNLSGRGRTHSGPLQ